MGKHFVIAVCIAIGVAIDKLIPLRHKQKLQLAMIRWWNRLDETPIPDYPKLLASWVVIRVERLSRKPWLPLIVYSAISILFLSAAGLHFGKEAADPTFVDLRLPEMAYPLKDPNIFDRMPLPHVTVLMVVFIFDFANLLLTVKSLKFIRKSNATRSLLILLVNLLTTTALAAVCFASVMHVEDFILNHNFVGEKFERQIRARGEVAIFNYHSGHLPELRGLKVSTNAVVTRYRLNNSFWGNLRQTPDVFWRLIRGDAIVYWTNSISTAFRDKGLDLEWTHSTAFHLDRPILLLSGTVYYPCLMLVIGLVFMLVAKLVLSVVRFAIMYFCDLASEVVNPKDCAPATLLGTVLALLIWGIQRALELYSAMN